MTQNMCIKILFLCGCLVLCIKNVGEYCFSIPFSIIMLQKSSAFWCFCAADWRFRREKWYIKHAGSVVFTILPAWVYFFENVFRFPKGYRTLAEGVLEYEHWYEQENNNIKTHPLQLARDELKLEIFIFLNFL